MYSSAKTEIKQLRNKLAESKLRVKEGGLRVLWFGAMEWAIKCGKKDFTYRDIMDYVQLDLPIERRRDYPDLWREDGSVNSYCLNELIHDMAYIHKNTDMFASDGLHAQMSNLVPVMGNEGDLQYYYVCPKCGTFHLIPHSDENCTKPKFCETCNKDHLKRFLWDSWTPEHKDYDNLVKMANWQHAWETKYYFHIGKVYPYRIWCTLKLVPYKIKNKLFPEKSPEFIL
jgi:hypothetical protein